MEVEIITKYSKLLKSMNLSYIYDQQTTDNMKTDQINMKTRCNKLRVDAALEKHLPAKG